MPDMGELGLALEVRWEHLGFHPVSLRGSAVLVIILLLVGAPVEVRRPLVFVRPTMLANRISSTLASFICRQGGTYISVPRNQVAHVA